MQELAQLKCRIGVTTLGGPCKPFVAKSGVSYHIHAPEIGKSKNPLRVTVSADGRALEPIDRLRAVLSDSFTTKQQRGKAMLAFRGSQFRALSVPIHGRRKILFAVSAEFSI